MAKRRNRGNKVGRPSSSDAPLNYGAPLPPSPGPGALRQQGSSLSFNYLGTFNGFLQNPNWSYIQEYERSYLTDETVGTGIEFIVLSMLASMGDYYHPDPEIQKFVRTMFINMNGTPHQFVGEMVTSALWSGHAVSESVLATDGKYFVLKSVESYHPANIYYVVDKNGKLTWDQEPGLPGSSFTTGVYQRHPFNGTYIKLPKNRTCVISHNKRHNNYYGESVIQRIFKNWLFKDAVFGMWAVALDRYGTPIPVVITPRVLTGRKVTDPYVDGQVRAETFADAAGQVLQNLSTGGSLIFEEPSKEHPVKVSTLTQQNNFGTSFLDAVRYTNAAIFRGMLIPKLLLEEGKSGSSKGLGQIHFNVFRMMMTSLYLMMVHPIVQQIVGPIVYWNFGSRDPGMFPIVPFDSTTAEIIGSNLDKLVNTGVVDTNSLHDLNMLRQVFGFSAVSEDVFRKREYLANAKASAPAKPGAVVADNTLLKKPVPPPKPAAVKLPAQKKQTKSASSNKKAGTVRSGNKKS